MNDWHVSYGGTVKLQGSKSILQRVMLIASLMEYIELEPFSDCDDVVMMYDILKTFGCRFEKEGQYLKIIQPSHYPYHLEYQISGSATALRFWFARAVINEHTISEIRAVDPLSLRPIKPLLQGLRYLGADIAGDRYPYRVAGKVMNGGEIEITANISSQFISALLMVAPYFQRGLKLKWTTPPVSYGYVKMTITIMRELGVNVIEREKELIVLPGQKYTYAGVYQVEPDLSSASYFAALGAISDQYITIPYHKTNSIQPDFRIFQILIRMGANVQFTGLGYRIIRKVLKGITYDMSTNPDLVPTIACLALLAEGETRLLNVHHLKYKESDRIQALLEEISSIGGKIVYENGNLVIQQLEQAPPARILKTYQDHRLVMAFSLLQVVFPQLRLDDESAVSKSFPGFFIELNKLKK
ncbi:MAG TPA: 3-phosphoshikimate 1-carboxyvinyltransferase [Candidatus Cloacimonadota bacterium]|nr:3-phosphoshikimate 1-carboxyvinyltransferase [Candidatus Cloacimonadota bacterium]